MAENELTKLTVNLIPAAVLALKDASTLLEDTRTDTVNRALQVYRQIAFAAHRGGGRGTWKTVDGRECQVVVRPKRWWRRG